MADFYGEPNSFNYPRKPANLMNMQAASFWSPYIRHGVCTHETPPDPCSGRERYGSTPILMSNRVHLRLRRFSSAQRNR